MTPAGALLGLSGGKLGPLGAGSSEVQSPDAVHLTEDEVSAWVDGAVGEIPNRWAKEPPSALQDWMAAAGVLADVDVHKAQLEVVAVQSALSPLLDPSVAGLGTTPRLPLGRAALGGAAAAPTVPSANQTAQARGFLAPAPISMLEAGPRPLPGATPPSVLLADADFHLPAMAGAFDGAPVVVPTPSVGANPKPDLRSVAPKVGVDSGRPVSPDFRAAGVPPTALVDAIPAEAGDADLVRPFDIGTVAPTDEVDAPMPRATIAGAPPSLVRKDDSMVRWTAKAATPGPVTTNLRAPQPSARTFDDSPWLFLDDAVQDEAPPSSATRPQLAARPVPATAAGMVRAGPVPSSLAEVPTEGTTARNAGGVAPRGTVVAQALPQPSQSAPESAFWVPERPIERLDVRVGEGRRALQVGITRDTDGYAVEVRSHRDFVAEIQHLEGDIDASLRENGGDGLASFDASADDGAYDSADEDGVAEFDAPASSDEVVKVDPRRLLDRRA